MELKVDQAQKPLEFFDRGGLGMIDNGSNMGGERSNASSSDSVAQEENRGLGKETLVKVDKETIVAKEVEEGGEVGKMGGEGGTGDKNVI